MILQEFHVHVRVLRSVQVVADGWSHGVATIEVVARSAVVSSSSVVRIQGLGSDEATACGQTTKARVQTALELVDQATVHGGRICARRRYLHRLILVRMVRILILEAVVLPGLRVAQLRIHLVRVLLLAVVAELVELVGVATGDAHPVRCRGPAVLRRADLVATLTVQVLLVHKTDLGAVGSRSLAPRDAGTDRLVDIDDASGALQRVTPEAVRLVAALVERPTRELTLALVCIL